MGKSGRIKPEPLTQPHSYHPSTLAMPVSKLDLDNVATQEEVEQAINNIAEAIDKSKVALAALP